MAGEGVALLLWLVLTGVWVYVSYWVSRDARRRGSRHHVAWGVGVFLIGPLGLLLYLVVRGDVGGRRGRGSDGRY